MRKAQPSGNKMEKMFEANKRKNIIKRADNHAPAPNFTQDLK
jgi:hypothetical protein